ncbi:MAG TPA: hypothetical protein VGL38_11775 [bacterium]|jgi:methyl-accepting chemotaxis protein
MMLTESAVGTERMGDAIRQIKEASGQTSKIIKTSDTIAFQINLLALKAAWKQPGPEKQARVLQ